MPTHYEGPIGPYNVSFTSSLARTCEFYVIICQGLGSEVLNPTDPNSASVNYSHYALLVHAPDDRNCSKPELLIITIYRYDKSNSFPIVPGADNGTVRSGGRVYSVFTEPDSNTRVFIASPVNETIIKEIQTTIHVAPFDPNWKKSDNSAFAWMNDEQIRITKEQARIFEERVKKMIANQTNTITVVHSIPNMGFGNYTFDEKDKVRATVKKGTDVVHMMAMEELPTDYGYTKDSAQYTITSTGTHIKGYIDYTLDGYVIVMQPRTSSLTKGEFMAILDTFHRID